MHLKPNEDDKKWQGDKNHLANKLYAEIFPILARYEVRGYNAHQRTQSIVAEAMDSCHDWVIRNIRTKGIENEDQASNS